MPFATNARDHSQVYFEDDGGRGVPLVVLGGFGEHASERVLSLVIMGQQPYAMSPDGPLARMVSEALAGSDEGAMERLVESFEAMAGPYPEEIRASYLACDPAAMRSAATAAMTEGAISSHESTAAEGGRNPHLSTSCAYSSPTSASVSPS